MTYRVYYEGYIEGEYLSEEAAIQDYLESLENITEEDISVEVFNDETKEWE